MENVMINGIDLIEMDEQYIFWWLGREPSQKDFNKIDVFLQSYNAFIVNFSKYCIEYRTFFDKTIAMHIILSKKYWGFAVNIHIDIGVHYRSIFNSQTLRILSKLYIYLNKVRYGKCYLLPRQKREFDRFMKGGKKRWNLI